jgi:hypothetical protein
MTRKAIALIAMTFTLSACWNAENVHVRLEDVSLG